MLLAFVGDVHGCTAHAFAALMRLQDERQVRLDAIVQVGDLGAHRSTETLAESDRWYLTNNPAQAHIFQVLGADDATADVLRVVRDTLGGPMHAISGNHEDDAWVARLHAEADDELVVQLDPAGSLVHVASGSVLTMAGLTVAFLGGIDAPGRPFDLDPRALDALHAFDPGSIDVLVTHDGPHGMCTSWDGRVQGSHRLTHLIERLQPTVHVSGHYHHRNGPRSYGRTTSFALDALVHPTSDRWSGESINPMQRVSPGSIGLLDSSSLTFEYVEDDWLEQISGDDIGLRRGGARPQSDRTASA